MEVYLPKTMGGLNAGPTKKTSAREGGVEAAAGEGSPVADQAQASATPSLQLAALKERLLAEPAVDSARVARISGEIQSGNYTINPQRAAEKFMAMEIGLP